MLHELYTPQGETLREIPWQVYPRPQLARESYVNLNGIWDFTVSESDALPEQWFGWLESPLKHFREICLSFLQSRLILIFGKSHIQ